MSRSYKKNPWVTDHKAGTTKETKKFANKTVRHRKNLPSGKAYRKAFESWNICDYKYMWTWEEAKKQWEKGDNVYLKRRYPTLKSYYRYWLKCTKGK